MIKANTKIIADGKTFEIGQTVTGLSKLDKKWMLKAGHITETVSKKEETEQPVQVGEEADEQL